MHLPCYGCTVLGSSVFDKDFVVSFLIEMKERQSTFAPSTVTQWLLFITESLEKFLSAS